MSQNPLVSIVIPVYNGADYLARAVDSALSQTYTNTEVIVVNDGSTDSGATEAVAKRFGDRIRYVSKPNGGVATALNRGIEEMRGEYLSWLSHDDMYTPEKIEAQVECLASVDSENTVLVSGVEAVNAEEQRLWIDDRYREGEAITLMETFCGHPLHGCTLLIPRAVLNRVGKFDEGLRHTQDYDLWFRMYAADVSFIYQKRIFVKWRIHAGQGTQVFNRDHMSEGDRVARNYVEQFQDREELNFTRMAVWLKYGKGLPEAAALAARLGRKHRGALYLLYRLFYLAHFAFFSGKGWRIFKDGIRAKLRGAAAAAAT